MSPSTRALLAAARDGHGPDPAAAARLRAKLDAVLAGTAAGAAAPAVAPVASGGLAVKLAAALVVAGAVVVVAVPRHAPAPTAAPALSLDEAAQLEAPPPVVHAAVREPAAPVAVPVRHVAHAAPAAVPRPVPVAEVSLAREVELLDQAMAGLRAGRPDETLAAIATFHRETGDRGQLIQEASAIEIEASCKLHLDVRAKLAAFDQAWPSSAQRSRLTAACR